MSGRLLPVGVVLELLVDVPAGAAGTEPGPDAMRNAGRGTAIGSGHVEFGPGCPGSCGR